MMQEQGFTIADLELQRVALEDRVMRLEADLQCPLEMDAHEQANQLSNNMMLMRLLEIERSNLRKVNFEIERRKQNNSLGMGR